MTEKKISGRKKEIRPLIGVGCRIGRLTITAPTEKRKGGYMVWLCRCDCGGEIMLDTRCLQRQTVTDCGCVSKVKPGQRDIAGMRFGKLTAIKPDGQVIRGSAVWLCRCDCGGEVHAPLHQLTAGYRKSCGCLGHPARKDYVGKRFGRLTVTAYAGKRGGMHRWKCVCDCGRETVVGQTLLQTGKTRSCGCLQAEVYRDNLKLIDGTSVTVLETTRNRLIASNTSGHTGVYLNRRNDRWAAQITFKGKTYYLGSYADKKEAVLARRRGEEMHDDFLEWYYVNHPRDGSTKAADRQRAAAYTVVKIIHRAGAVAFFIFLPGLGFLIYYLPGLIQAFLEKVGVDREAVLTHTFEIDRQPEHPDVREALNVVPVEDAMAVGENTEKRALLLKQLKKNLKENYRILLAAERDEDSESAHYVAAAKMEIYRLGQARWLECRRDYEQDPGNPEKYHAACEALTEMLASGVLSAREQSAYRKHLCGLVQGQIETGESEVSLREYEEYLNSLVELGRYADAEILWRGHAGRMRSEAAYQDMLKMFYRTGERQKFEELLDDLRKNKQIRLSPKGLEQLRYWMNRLAGAAMDN